MEFRSFPLTGEQIRAARAILRIEQADLAKAARVSLETIKRLERMRGAVEANTRTVNAISDAFRDFGIVFDLGCGSGPGLRFLQPDPILRQAAA